ncbi:Phospholipid metabolism enzyme regulator [Geosmithia morbida]|uniref:Phospholipid metabolism enzyme regulator n=1 Tax=Geosmithia morbida TaxID=1094350 RepID=A0A9P4YVY4_9HYPO|nr:Phospholipid metabolism enzyme regulator [Geosmithia morbida]KAF4122797.1 Phospholipid metabolism enzyme regulator [Geosmithia morbida]
MDDKSSTDPLGAPVDQEPSPMTMAANDPPRRRRERQEQQPAAAVAADAAATGVSTEPAHPTPRTDKASLPSTGPDVTARTPRNPSREPSPGRNSRRAASISRLSSASSLGSRRASQQQDISPTRQPMRQGVMPPRKFSARSLSAATIPSLPPKNQETTQIQSPMPRKPIASDLREDPRWPVSPRLKSPPPHPNNNNNNSSSSSSSSNSNSNISNDTATSGNNGNNNASTPSAIRQQEPSPINVPRSSPSPLLTSDSQNTTSGSDTEDSQTQSGLRTPARASLETVQEVSLPSSPSVAGDAVIARMDERLAHESDSVFSEEQTPRARPSMSIVYGSQDRDSGSDTGSYRPDPIRRPTSVPPPPMVQRQSGSVSKAPNPSQNMTVETETVASIPQVALTVTKNEALSNLLKTKPSTETIKPRKEKKRTSRKQSTVGTGNASSKSDIFEAKVAIAIDEANTSDSDETFVYDSNPPDGKDRSSRRFHSRTPSATSMVSQADRQNLRSIYGIMEAGPAHAPKKGMKFVNSVNAGSGGESLNLDDDGKGTGRSMGGSGRGTARHHHHIGRWGRQPGNGHPSLFDNESPFAGSTKPKVNGQSRNSSGPSSSPRNHHHHRHHHSGLNHKRSNYQLSSYDADDTGGGADDERTPLMGSMNNRTVRARRGPHSLRQAESQSFERRPSYLTRFAACLVLTMMFLLVITGAIGLMFATSQPMSNIDIVSIGNVVTSEQVLMFDLTVRAHNPNIVVVTVDHANLEIFAKSEHAGTDSEWWKMPRGPDEMHTLDDPINDPPLDDDDGHGGRGGHHEHDGDDEQSRPNVLLGRVTQFDSPLTFEGSLFHKGYSTSTGQMQLPYPGNSTSGGSERWERIYQDEFDLIVKGVVKYTLPLSARIRSATVAGRAHVDPNSANDPTLQPNGTAEVLTQDA